MRTGGKKNVSADLWWQSGLIAAGIVAIIIVSSYYYNKDLSAFRDDDIEQRFKALYVETQLAIENNYTEQLVALLDEILDEKPSYIDKANLIQKLRVINPTNNPYVYAYIWNNNQTETYLLDSSSSQGKQYDLEWIVTSKRIWFKAKFLEKQSSIMTLSPELLVIAIAFSNDPTRTAQDIYERRFHFKLTDDNQIEILLPVETWHNPRWPDEAGWLKENIDSVMMDR